MIDGAHNAQECNHIDLRYVQSTAARVRDHVGAKRRRRLARVRSSEEFFCTVRSLLASFDRTIFSLACGLLQPRSQAPPSFPSLAVRFSVLQAMESWAGPGNEAFAWRCQLAPLLGGHPRKATKHNFVPTTTPTFATAVFILCRYNSDVSSKRSLIHARLAAKQCKLWCTATYRTPVAWDGVGTSLI